MKGPATMRRKADPPHVPAIVVSYIGRIAFIATLIAGLLVWRTIETSAGSQQAADAAVIGLVMAFIAVATGGVATLGAILASTRSGGATEPPTPVVVQNAASDPVPTTEAAAPADKMPDPTGADPGPLPVIDDEAGHSELLLLLVIITGVFVGGFLLHLVLA